MTDINQAATAVPAIKLTRDEKFAKRIDLLSKRIAADTAELAAVTLESTTSGRLEGVDAGTLVIVRLGRAGSPAQEAVAAVEYVAEYTNVDGVVVPAVEGVAAKAATAGKAGTVRLVQALVLATKELEDGSLRYKVEHGEGFDKDIEIVQASQITEVCVAVEAVAA